MGCSSPVSVRVPNPDCRFKTAIALCLINSMYSDALVEKPY